MGMMRKNWLMILAFAIVVLVSVNLDADKSYATLAQVQNFNLGDNISANYDAGSETLTISGNGTIDRSKWIQMTQTIDINNSNGTIDFESGTTENDKMVFQATSPTQRIALPADSSYLFCEWKGEIHNLDNDNLDTSNLISMKQIFSHCENFNQPVDFDTSEVMNMYCAFSHCYKFNKPVSFNTQNVENMYAMFSNCKEFNQPINFNTPKVENMKYMFTSCEKFNSSVSFSDTSKVKNMFSMFYKCGDFEQEISFDAPLLTNAKTFVHKSPKVSSVRLIGAKQGTAQTGQFMKSNEDLTGLEFLEIRGLQGFTLPSFKSDYAVWEINDDTGEKTIVSNGINQRSDSFTFQDSKHYLVKEAFEITYQAGTHGTIAGGTNPIIVEKGSNIIDATDKPIPTAEAGYKFDGWYIGDTPVTNQIVTGNVTVTAKFKKKQYTVTYNGNGSDDDNNKPANGTKTHGVDFDVATQGNLTKTGYTFEGWTENQDGSGTVYKNGDTLYQNDANVTLYAKWTINQYTVTFDQNYVGKPVDTTDTVNYDSLVTEPANPTRNGYTFGGWYKESGCTTAWDFAVDKVTADTTLYAKWQLKTYTVTYNGNGSDNDNNKPANGTKTHGVDFDVATQGNLTKTGYTFAGWTENQDGSGTVYKNGDTLYQTDADVTLYAKWITNQYTVTFDQNYVGNPGDTTATVNYDSLVTAPANPTRNGYTFGGWYKESGCTTAWDFAVDKVTADTTLYAKWQLKTYTVTYNGNGSDNDNNKPADGTKTHGVDFDVATQGNLTKTGYTFAGWTENQDGSGTVYKNGDTLYQTDANVTLYAKWTIDQYTVTFDQNYVGKPVDTTDTVNYDSLITEPANPTRNGYTFGGWYKESGCTTVWNFNVDKVTADTTLYAKWTINEYTVTFDQNYVGNPGDTTVTVNYDSLVTEPANPTRNGYTFGGWYKESGCTTAWDFAVDKVTADTTLYAKWQLKTYTVTYNGNGSDDDNNKPANGTKTHGVDFDVATQGNLTKTGYTFEGWTENQDGSGTVYKNGDTLYQTDADVTLYAKWTINQYTVTFDQNYVGKPVDTTDTVNYDSLITEPANPTRNGYTFGGWYKESGCTTAWDFAVDKVTADTTLYAKWTTNQYTVTFDQNYVGNPGDTTVTVNYDSLVTAPADPVRNGYNFGGWYKESACTTAWDFAVDKVTADTTLYAKWQLKTYTVTYNGNGSDDDNNKPVDDIKTHGVNFDVATQGNLTKTGYTFAGWTENQDGSGTVYKNGDTLYQTDADVTLYAKWTINQYTVTFDQNYVGKPVDTIATVNYDSLVTAPADPVRNGYTFGGWYKESACTTVWNFNVDKVTADTTLYAKWTTNQYTVTFDQNYVGKPVDTTATVNYDSLVTAPADPVRNGYNFGGWYKESACTIVWDFNADKVTADTTLYAKFVKNNVIATAEIIVNTGQQNPDSAKYVIVTINPDGGRLPQGTPLSFYVDKTANKTVKDVLEAAGLYAVGVVTPLNGQEFNGWSLGINDVIGGDAELKATYRSSHRSSGSSSHSSGHSSNNNNNNQSNNESDKVEKTREIDGKIVEKRLPLEKFDIKSFTTLKLNKIDRMAYMRGYQDGTFRPNNNITRAEIATVLTNIVILNEEIRGQDVSMYKDMSRAEWYDEFVGFMTKHKVLKGYPDGTFKPNGGLTRAEFATLISKFIFLDGADKTETFKDVDSNHWAKKYIASVKKMGIMRGYPDGTFKPNKLVTRAEVANTINKILQRQVDVQFINKSNELKKYSDDDNHWAYYDIQMASNSYIYEFVKGVEKWKQIIKKKDDSN